MIASGCLLRQSRLDRALQTFIRVVTHAPAVDVDRRCAVDAELTPIYKVALNLLGALAAIKRRVEFRAVKTKFSCILFELVDAERGLVTEKYADVFPVLTLLARSLSGFSSLARVRVLRKREVAHNQLHSITELTHNPL